MDCTRDSIGKMDLDSLVESISAIYAKHDQHRSIWDVWSHALHHAAAVAEELRKGDLAESKTKLKQELADLVLWLFTALKKLQGNWGKLIPNAQPQDSLVRISVEASRLMWNRYPGICPWCYRDNELVRRPCCCDVLKISLLPKVRSEIQQRARHTRALAKKNISQMPKSLDEWQNLIATLYEERLRNISIEAVMLHLLEEMGEASDGMIRMYTFGQANPEVSEIRARQIRLEDELADTLSWTFGLIERLKTEGMSSGRLLLSEILWTQYGSDEQHSLVCRHCKRSACTCSVHFISTQRGVSELLEKVSGSHAINSRK